MILAWLRWGAKRRHLFVFTKLSNDSCRLVTQFMQLCLLQIQILRATGLCEHLWLSGALRAHAQTHCVFPPPHHFSLFLSSFCSPVPIVWSTFRGLATTQLTDHGKNSPFLPTYIEELTSSSIVNMTRSATLHLNQGHDRWSTHLPNRCLPLLQTSRSVSSTVNPPRTSSAFINISCPESSFSQSLTSWECHSMSFCSGQSSECTSMDFIKTCGVPLYSESL